MDDIISYFDTQFLTPYVYPKSWAEDDVLRQTLTLSMFLVSGGYVTYFVMCGLSYLFLFDKRLLQHKKMLPNQIAQEIDMACKSVPIMALLTVPFFILDIRGHSQLIESVNDYPGSHKYLQLVLYFIGFILWNDTIVYWVHRGLHHPLIYKHIHKPHHKWLVPTPFAAFAFHPIDGWSQSLSYHFYILIFPMPKWIFLIAFVAVNLWTVSIHDEMFAIPNRWYLRELINGAAHHTDHHLFFNYNHGLYFTLWDRLGGTYRKPSSYNGHGPFQDLGLKIN